MMKITTQQQQFNCFAVYLLLQVLTSLLSTSSSSSDNRFCCTCFTIPSSSTTTTLLSSSSKHLRNEQIQLYRHSIYKQQHHTSILLLRKTVTVSSLYSTTSNDDSNSNNSHKLHGLNVAIIGGGPSGLLVAHKLLYHGASTVTIYERRARPIPLTTNKELRAYALGVGIRGRTAIQSSSSNNNDDDITLWDSIKRQVGYSSERFILHIGPLSIKLRDENDSRTSNDDNNNQSSSSSSSKVGTLEPSLLLYQSDLCGVLINELDERYKSTSSNNRLKYYFNCTVSGLDLQSKTVSFSTTTTNGNPLSNNKEQNKYDIIIGCDGVNSIVRKEIAKVYNDFDTKQELLPGVFKVIQCNNMPPLLDPTAVQLVFPKSGTITAFVEPVSKTGQCCILFAGNNSTDILFSNNVHDIPAIENALFERYPKLVGFDVSSAAQQLVAQGIPTQASYVTCNIYHYSNVAVLIGDAAHATGGVSGQGVNSALQDAAIFVNTLVQNYNINNKDESIRTALLQYSIKAVPEGKALYDLSFGPKPSTIYGKIRYGIKSTLDILFKGKLGIGELPLQTMLTLSLQSFADIRRKRDIYYDTPFPTQEKWEEQIIELDNKMKTLVTK